MVDDGGRAAGISRDVADGALVVAQGPVDNASADGLAREDVIDPRSVQIPRTERRSSGAIAVGVRKLQHDVIERCAGVRVALACVVTHPIRHRVVRSVSVRIELLPDPPVEHIVLELDFAGHSAARVLEDQIGLPIPMVPSLLDLRIVRYLRPRNPVPFIVIGVVVRPVAGHPVVGPGRVPRVGAVGNHSLAWAPCSWVTSRIVVSFVRSPQSSSRRFEEMSNNQLPTVRQINR